PSRSGVVGDAPGVGGSGKNPKATNTNHAPHDMRSPPTLGRGPPHTPLRCDGPEPESSHVTPPKAIDPRVQWSSTREGLSGGPMPRERSMIDIATQLVLLFAACVEEGSTFTVVGEAPLAAQGSNPEKRATGQVRSNPLFFAITA